MQQKVFRVSLFYALRDIRRRPVRFLSLSAIVCAALVSLTLLLLFMEAQWRADVMPDREENYHFTLDNLSEKEAAYAESLPWVQAAYRSVSPTNEDRICLRIRSDWEHCTESGELVRELIRKIGLFRREPYAAMYDTVYDGAMAKFHAYWYGATEANGLTDTRFAETQAYTHLIDHKVTNQVFMQKTVNSYVIQRDFFTLILMFCAFTAAAFTILIENDYRRSFEDFGCLRALGFTNGHLLCIHLIRSFFIYISALPGTFLVSAGFLALFRRMTAASITEETAYLMDVTAHLPIPLMLILFSLMLGAVLLGTGAVCFLHRREEIMSLLRGVQRMQISFVAETSEAFAESDSIREYGRLYLRRSRRSMLYTVIVTSLVMPLPFHLFSSLIELLPAAGTQEVYPVFLYTLLQTLAVFITTLCITVTAARSAVSMRARELGILRSLGADRDCIRTLIYPAAWIQSLYITICSLFMIIWTHIVSRNHFDFDVKAEAGSGARLINTLLSDIFGSALFVIPATFLGTVLFLRYFFRTPILTSMNDKE